MGWGFRKSTTIGGVRLTLSKSGISTSVGGKGWRLTSGPRGVYVTAGFSGFSYRQRFGGGSSSRAPARLAPPAATTPQFYASQHFDSAGVEQLTDISQDEFVSSLNEWTTRGVMQLVTGLVACAAFVIALVSEVSDSMLAEIAAYGAIAFLLARFVEHRRQRFLLVYDLDPRETERYERLSNALAELAASGRFRGVKMIGHHGDWKRNAGATRALEFESAAMRRALPPHILTNLAPWTLFAQGMELYFFPDRILIRSRGRFAALSYQALEVEMFEASFVWDESLPSDAQVTGQTWLYVRRDGGPDRRFNGNRQIPIVRTAYVTFKSTTGLEAVVQTTRVCAAERWQTAAREYAKAPPQLVARLDGIEPHVAAALQILGLHCLPTMQQLNATHADLSRRVERLSKGARELRVFAMQRRSEVDATYCMLGALVAPEAATQLPITQPVTSSPLTAEVLATAFAMACSCVVFAGFRTTPPAAAASDVTAPSVPATAAAPITVASPALPRGRVKIACPLREEPSSSAKQTLLLARNAEVEVVDKQAGWWRVRDSAGNEGWTGPKCWVSKRSVRKRPETVRPEDPYAETAPASGIVDPFPANGSGIVDPFPAESRSTE